MATDLKIKNFYSQYDKYGELKPINLLYPIQPNLELGAEGRLAIRQIIYLDSFLYGSNLENINETGDYIERRIRLVREGIRHQLSRELFDHIALKENPTTVRIVEKLDKDFSRNCLILSLYADLRDVMTMHNYQIELPPFEFVSPISVSDEKPVIEWQCMYCGACNLVVEDLECRKCGSHRKPLR